MKTSNTGKWPRPVGSEYHLVRVVNFRNIYTMESVFSKVVNTEEEKLDKYQDPISPHLGNP
jgi:hypothetical protein